MRVHTDVIQAPLKLNDLLNTMQNFRSGYLIVTPKDRTTGKLQNSHAVTGSRADRGGYIALATWREIDCGRLKTRRDGQWFIPKDPTHLELKINCLIRFIPFRPTVPADQ